MINQSKQCSECHETFHRVSKDNDLRWDRTKKCQDCRKNKKNQNIEPRPGHYEVKSKVIDDFLYKMPCHM